VISDFQKRYGNDIEERRMTSDFRIERDSMGELQVPVDALWGAQTQRAVNNFPISGMPMPARFIRALGLIKWAAAKTNRELGDLDTAVAEAIEAVALRIADGEHADQFPVDVFQTGSGTSSNMNANEVIARLAGEVLGKPVHPNDHVNMGQSSNDVIPSAIHVSAALALTGGLLPALEHLANTIEQKARSLADVVKTGRTHLMDAMPVRFDQELGGWAAQIRSDYHRVAGVLSRLSGLAQGGTAVGTGINAHPEFGLRVAASLAERTGVAFRPAESYFEAMSSQDTAVELSGQLKTTAVGIMKIANDLRWMNSGPLAGLGEIRLPALQPGSSIMPGKVNPVVPEAVAMACARVLGHDATVSIAGQSGNFQLNVMLPVIAHSVLESIRLLGGAATLLARRAIAGLEADAAHLAEALERNPVLVTALNPVIGYERGATIAKRALAEGRSVRDVAVEMSGLDEAELDRLLEPARLTRGGLPDGS
jgi:fumarate hydratase class II